MAQHHPDRCNQQRPVPLTPYPHTNNTHTHPHLFTPPYLPSLPHLPHFVLPRSSPHLSHHQCSFISWTSYLSRLLSALAFWCQRERCAYGVGGITCLPQIPLWLQVMLPYSKPLWCNACRHTHIHSMLHLFSRSGIYTVFSLRLWCHPPTHSLLYLLPISPSIENPAIHQPCKITQYCQHQTQTHTNNIVPDNQSMIHETAHFPSVI